MRRLLARHVAAALFSVALIAGCGAPQESGSLTETRSTAAAVDAPLLHQEAEQMTRNGPCTGVGSTLVTYYCNGDTTYNVYAFAQAGSYRITVRGASSDASAAGIAVYVAGTKIGTVIFTGTAFADQAVTFPVAAAGPQEIRLKLETDTGANDTIVDWYELAAATAGPASPDPAQLGFEGSQFATWNAAGAYNYDDTWTVASGTQGITFAQDTTVYKAGAASLRISGTMQQNRYWTDYISAARIFLNPERASVDFTDQTLTVHFYLASGTADNVQVILNDASYQPCQGKYQSLGGAGQWRTVTFVPGDPDQINYVSPSFNLTRVAFVEVRLSSGTVGAPMPIVWNVDSISWASPNPPKPPPVLPATGAAVSGVYRNLFREWDSTLAEADVQAKLDQYWNSLFASTDDDRRVYYPAGSNANGPMAYVLDVGNGDVRSEGMSYGMMIALQMDRKAEFDALWNFARTHMQHQAGARAGYFAWQVKPTGEQLDPNSASDGEEYFATALFMASGRWGDGGGIYHYSAEANGILDAMLHKEDVNDGVVDGVTNMFDRTRKQVVFVPYQDAATFTDPSYHLPAFYELWGRWAAGWNGQQAADRQFWLDAASTSRTFFGLAANAATGLSPDYAHFDGTPNPWNGHGDFRFDAWRTAMNWAVDYAWWAKDQGEVSRTDTLQSFFASEGIASYVNQYALDGTPLSTGRSQGLIAMNGVASLAASKVQAWDHVSALWGLSPPTGQWRYYDGMLSFLAVLHASGQFRIYAPPPPPTAAPASPSIVDAAVSGGQVRLTWQDRSDDEWAFLVQRRTHPHGAYTTVARVGTDVTAWTDTTVEKGKYYYRIVASNPAGSSASRDVKVQVHKCK